MKGIIFYTDNTLDINISSQVEDFIRMANLPIVSASLKPIAFGDNEVIRGKRSYPTMVRQIISCLERSTAKYVFFCEHDVLYHYSHFDFTPPRDDIFYYNENVWRWGFGSDTAIRYDRMLSLSGMCVNREYVLEHYYLRRKKIMDNSWENDEGQPRWVRIMGYEPGTKKKRRGGITDDDFGTWKSRYSNIDIRHKGTFSPAKLKLKDFKHKPKWWKEINIEDIKSVDLRRLFSHMNIWENNKTKI